MNVEPHHSIKELQHLHRSEINARMARRIKGVWLARRGLSCSKIMDVTGAKRRTIQEWVERYNRGGIERLFDQPRSGAPRKLTPEAEQKIFQRIQGGPQKTDKVSVFSAPVIREIIQREYGVLYSLTGLLDWLHRMGLSYLAPRPRHDKADPQAQEEFKKKSRKHWLKSQPSIQTKQ